MNDVRLLRVQRMVFECDVWIEKRFVNQLCSAVCLDENWR